MKLKRLYEDEKGNSEKKGDKKEKQAKSYMDYKMEEEQKEISKDDLG